MTPFGLIVLLERFSLSSWSAQQPAAGLSEMRPQRIVRQFVGGAASLPKHAASTRLSSFRGYCAPTDRKRDGGTEDVVGVVKLFDPGQSFHIGTKALRCTVGVV